MKYKVKKKQPNSKKCLVCGLKNDFGLKAVFYELENNELAAIFRPVDEHQSYPGRLHGGIATAVLDETIGRAILITDNTVWGVTVELSVRFKKTIPLDEEIKVIGRITKDTNRLFEGSGEILLANGDVAVTAKGKYLKMPLEKIADFDFEEQDWKVVHSEKEPVEIELWLER